MQAFLKAIMPLFQVAWSEIQTHLIHWRDSVRYVIVSFWNVLSNKDVAISFGKTYWKE